MLFYLCYLCVAFSGLITSLYCTPTKRSSPYENSECQNKNEAGICTILSDCPQAYSDVKTYKRHNFTRCGFAGINELVCCPMLHSLRSNNMTRKSEGACDAYSKSFSNIVFPQIAGGQNATVGQFPYMAALGFYSEAQKIYNFRCGGTLISEKYVITAAHCLWNAEEEEVEIIRLGVVNVPEYVDHIDETFDFKVRNYTIHPKYNRRSNLNDIALIEMQNSVELKDDLRPACLFTKAGDYPEEFIITGWGIVDDNYRRTNVLQKAFVKLASFEKCAKTYAKAGKQLQESQMCAGHIRSDICKGDSGGPLLMRNSDIPVLVGISSFGLPGCSGGISVYTSVSRHLNWIEKIVWE